MNHLRIIVPFQSTYHRYTSLLYRYYIFTNEICLGFDRTVYLYFFGKAEVFSPIPRDINYTIQYFTPVRFVFYKILIKINKTFNLDIGINDLCI